MNTAEQNAKQLGENDALKQFRMAMSMRNGWLDDENRAYIIYTIDNIREDLGCARATCVKVIKELDSDNGIGLIEKKRRELGKPDIIYVKNFAAAPDKKPEETAVNADVSTEVQKSDPNYTDYNQTDMNYINPINP